MMNTTSNRPPSEDLVDLHVFVVPVQSWLGKYSVAYNNVALQSTSAGFIRVYSHATLQIVRELIDEQLETDVIPNEFVFLRSVGRCLAVVNHSQEKTLKAKHFLPPVAFSPEIFILPGSHEWIASLRKQTKSIIVNGDITLQDEYRLNNGEYYSREASEDNPISEQYSDYGDDVNGNSYTQRDPVVQRSRSNERPNESPAYNKEPNSPESEVEGDSRDPSEMLPQNVTSKRNRQHLADIVKSKKRSAEREGYSRQTKNGYANKIEKSPRHLNANYAETDELTPQNYKKYAKAERDESPMNSRKMANENAKSKNEKKHGDDTRSMQSDVVSRNGSHSGRKHENDLAKMNTRTDADGYRKERSVKSDGDSPSSHKERSNNIGNGRDIARDRSETLPRLSPAVQVLHPEIIAHPTTPYSVSRPTPIPSANVIHSTLKMESYERPSEDKFHRNDDVDSPSEKNENSNSSPTEDRPESFKDENDSNEENAQSYANNRYIKSPHKGPSHEDMKRREEEKRRLEEEKAKMEEKKKNMENDTMQMMREMEEMLRQKKEEEERRRIEEEKRKQEEKDRIERKKHEAFELRDKLIEIREERVSRQKEREGLMKNARVLKATLTAKRSAEPSVWEKKYLVEKERAQKLEEELSVLKSELTASQQKLLKSFQHKETDVPNEQKSPRTVMGPSQLNNLKNEVRQMTKEKEGLTIDIEKTKRKLNIEIQEKDTAQQELKELRNMKRAMAMKVEKDRRPQTKLSNAAN